MPKNQGSLERDGREMAARKITHNTHASCLVWVSGSQIVFWGPPDVPEISMGQYFFSFYCYILFRCVDRLHFITSPVGKNLGCFHFLSVANNVA